MDHFGNGIVTVFNGIWTTLIAVASPLTLGLLVLVAGLGWLARLEVDELDRQASKPRIDRH
jgi:hypothetical protein